MLTRLTFNRTKKSSYTTFKKPSNKIKITRKDLEEYIKQNKDKLKKDENQSDSELFDLVNLYQPGEEEEETADELVQRYYAGYFDIDAEDANTVLRLRKRMFDLTKERIEKMTPEEFEIDQRKMRVDIERQRQKEYTEKVLREREAGNQEIEDDPEDIKRNKVFVAGLSDDDREKYDDMGMEDFVRYKQESQKYRSRGKINYPDQYEPIPEDNTISTGGTTTGRGIQFFNTWYYRWGMRFLNLLVILLILSFIYAFFRKRRDKKAVWGNQVNRADVVVFNNPELIRKYLENINLESLSEDMSFRLSIVIDIMRLKGIEKFGFGYDKKQGNFYLIRCEDNPQNILYVQNFVTSICAKSPELSVYRDGVNIYVRSRALNDKPEDNFLNHQLFTELDGKLNEMTPKSLFSIQSIKGYDAVLSGIVNEEENNIINGDVHLKGFLSKTSETIPKNVVDNSSLWIGVPWGVLSPEIDAMIHFAYELEWPFHPMRYIFIKPLARLLGLGDSLFLCHMKDSSQLEDHLSDIGLKNILRSPLIFGCTLKYRIVPYVLIKSFSATALFNRNVRYETENINYHHIYKTTTEEGTIYYGIIGNTFVITSNESGIRKYAENFTRRTERTFPIFKVDKSILDVVLTSTSPNISELLVEGETFAANDFLLKFSGETIKN